MIPRSLFLSMLHTFSHRHLRCRCRLHRHVHRHLNACIHASMLYSIWRNNKRIFEHHMELNWSTVQTSSETIVLCVLKCFGRRYNVIELWLHAYIRIDTCIDIWHVDAHVDASENVWCFLCGMKFIGIHPGRTSIATAVTINHWVSCCLVILQNY